MLSDQDKIFQNLHGFEDAFLEGAKKRVLGLTPKKFYPKVKMMLLNW